MIKESGNPQLNAFDDTTFEIGQNGYFEYTYSDALRKKLIEHGVGEDDEFSSVDFWAVAAANVDEWLISPEAEQYSDADKAIIAYLSKLPMAMCIQSESQPPSKQEKQYLSESNASLRNVVRHLPDSSLEGVLSRSVAFLSQQLGSTLSKEQIAAFTQLAQVQLNGVKAELAFEQILEKLGIEYREATAVEDLMGCDYVVAMSDGSKVEIDVKASTSQLEMKVKQNEVLTTLFVESVNHKTKNKKLMLVPYVSQSSYETRGTEHLFTIKPDMLELAAQKMDSDLFYGAKRAA